MEKILATANSTEGQSQTPMLISSDENAADLRIGIPYGTCLPASCSSEKVLEFFNSVLPDGIEASEATCVSNDPIPFDMVDIAAM